MSIPELHVAASTTRNTVVDLGTRLVLATLSLSAEMQIRCPRVSFLAACIAFLAIRSRCIFSRCMHSFALLCPLFLQLNINIIALTNSLIAVWPRLDPETHVWILVACHTTTHLEGVGPIATITAAKMLDDPMLLCWLLQGFQQIVLQCSSADCFQIVHYCKIYCKICPFDLHPVWIELVC